MSYTNLIVGMSLTIAPILIMVGALGAYIFGYRFVEVSLKVWDWIKDKTKFVLGKIWGFFVWLWHKIESWFLYAWGKVKYAFNFIVNHSKNIVNDIVDAVEEGVEKVKVVAGEAGAALVSAVTAIKNKFLDIVDLTKSLFNRFTKAVTDVAKAAFNTVIGWGESLVKVSENFVNFFKNLLGKITGVFDTIIEGIKSFWQLISDLPGEIIRGIEKAVKSAIPGI